MALPAELAFELPSIYSFPPFFTRQPNAQTYASQKAAWTTLILSYYRSQRLWRIDVNQETIEKIPIFSNKQIQRTPPSLKVVSNKREVEGWVFEGVGGGDGGGGSGGMGWWEGEQGSGTVILA
jgi:ESCRT-II complex subunit VPS25